jgi:hypothetical protein
MVGHCHQQISDIYVLCPVCPWFTKKKSHTQMLLPVELRNHPIPMFETLLLNSEMT